MPDSFSVNAQHLKDDEGRDLEFTFFEVEEASDELFELPWNEGESLAGKVSKVHVRIEDEGAVYPDYQPGQISLVTERVKAALEGARGAEFFPVEVSNARPDTPPYFALNCSLMVDAKLVGPKLQLDDAALAGAAVFLHRVRPRVLNVTAPSRVALEAAGPSLRFTSLAEPVVIKQE